MEEKLLQERKVVYPDQRVATTGGAGFYRLTREGIRKALPLFKGLHFTLAVNAIIEGNRPGEIYVDDLENPKSAFALAHEASCAGYLVGSPDNDEFNSSVQQVLIERFTPKLKWLGYEFAVLRYSPDEWATKIDVILKSQRPWKSYWFWFDCVRPSKTNWREQVPAGFSVENIDKKLLKRANLGNLSTVMNIVLEWNSIDDFLQKGYGVCLIHENTIISWCLLTKRAGNICEISVGTDERYRNAGYATLLGKALLEICFSNNLAPLWNCPTDNLASKAVAKKLGFEKILTYQTYNWFPRWYTYLYWTMKKTPKALIHIILQNLQNYKNKKASFFR